jgi:hypothetical protein
MTPERAYSESVERTGIERVISRIDFVRGLGGLALLAGIGIASLDAGGTAGWILGAVLLVTCAALLVALLRR